MTLGRVKECRVNHRVGDSLYAYFGGRVYTDYFRVDTVTASYLGSADSHTVVVGVHYIHIGINCKQRIGDTRRVVIVPVAVPLSDDTGGTCLSQPFDKSLVTPGGGGRPFQSAYLDYFCPAARDMTCIMSGGFSDSLVVGALKSSEIVAVDVTVKHDDRRTRLVHFLYHRSDCIGDERRRNYYVKTIVGKIANVVNLLFIVIIGRAYLDSDIFMKHHFAVYLIVHLVAPVILTAL